MYFLVDALVVVVLRLFFLLAVKLYLFQKIFQKPLDPESRILIALLAFPLLIMFLF
jgi:hypothetical protein